jgi:hypothetical protein
MANPKVLNLDDVSSDDEKVLRLDGTEHRAVEMTVEGYIDRLKRARTSNPDATEAEKIAETIEFLTEVYPTVTTARFRKLSLAQLTKVIEFTVAAPQDIVKAAVTAQTASEGNG